MPFISASVISPYNSIRGGAEGGLVPLLLDLYPNAAAAYSLRKLRTAYTGSAIEVRKTVAGETSIQDIGFVDNELDTASLLSFAEGGDVFVAKWYDQSSGNDTVQISQSAQPQIVDAGIVNEVSLNPALQFSSGGMATESPVDLNSASELWIFMVVNITDTATTQILYETSVNNALNNDSIQISIGSDRLSIASKSSSGRPIVSLSSPPLGVSLISARFRGGQTVLDTGQLYINGVEQSLTLLAAGTSPATFANYEHFLGARNGSSLPFLGDILFCDVMTSDQSLNRAGIESNINSNYKIYWDGSQTGLLDDYPNAAAAYSLRALNSAYTGPAIRVRRSSDNEEQDINLLYDGSLNTDSLLAFVGAGDGFVTTWYDQSGGVGNNAIQGTASKQPVIVSNGVVNLLNGEPAMNFIGPFVMELDLSQYPFTSGGSATEKSIFAVAENNGTTNQNLYNIADARDIYALTYNRSGNNTYGFLGANYGAIGGNITGQNIISSFAISPSSKTFNNSVEGLSSNLLRANFNDISIGSRGGSYAMNGDIQELVMYESNQLANRVAIETNINNYYTIY